MFEHIGFVNRCYKFPIPTSIIPTTTTTTTTAAATTDTATTNTVAEFLCETGLGVV